MRFAAFSVAPACAACFLVARIAGAQAGPSANPDPNATPAPTTGKVVYPQEALYRRALDAAPSSWAVAGLLGFELELRGAVVIPDAISPVRAPNLYRAGLSGDPTGDILRGTEKPYSYDPFALSVTAGYRFLPFLSAGVFFDYATFQVNDGTDSGDYVDTTSQLQRDVWQLGAYARFYLVAESDRLRGFPYVAAPALDRLQPWIELGVGYTEDTASYVRDSAQAQSPQPTLTDYYLSYQGVVVNARVGLDWRLAPVFAFGPVIGYGRTFPTRGCADVEPQSDMFNMSNIPAENSCASSTVQASGYGMFFGGIFAKITLGPDVR